MLADLKKNKEKNRIPWQVNNYALLVPAILDTLKSITGKVFAGYQDFEKWRAEEGKDFEVID